MYASPSAVPALYTLLFRSEPRPRMGGDGALDVEQRFQRVSIHAPAWGATAKTRTERPVLNVSIHAPAWGATY